LVLMGVTVRANLFVFKHGLFRPAYNFECLKDCVSRKVFGNASALVCEVAYHRECPR
jgi:hypothetical protein